MYTKQQIFEILKKDQIETVKQFRKKKPAVYLWYTRHRNLIGDLPLQYSKRPNNSLTKELCAEIAKKYKYRSEFQEKDTGAYSKALKLNWLEEICVHMVAKPFEPAKPWLGKKAHNRKNLLGKVFGKWTVISEAEPVNGYKDIFYNCKCECGTESVIRGHNLRQGTTTKCVNCSSMISKPTKDIHQFIQELGIEATLSDRSFGFELDIVVHSHKFIIEYDGLLWHSSKFRTTEASERARRDKIKATGYTCFRIFEDEWLDRPEIIKSMIRNRLGIKSELLLNSYEIKIIEEPSKYKQFFEDNHLDGYGRATFAVGAFLQEKLISAISFRPYIQGKYRLQAELARFVSDKNYNCYGVFSKLLKASIPIIKQKWNSQYIVSASDNRLSQGKLYANNGFKEEIGGDFRLNYYYYLHSKGLRVHRAQCKKLKPPKITSEQYTQYPTEKGQCESGLMANYKWGKNEPLYKIWGWGNKLWVRKL